MTYYSKRGELETALTNLDKLQRLGLDLDHHAISIAENVVDRVPRVPLFHVFRLVNAMFSRTLSPPEQFFNKLVSILAKRSHTEECQWLLLSTLSCHQTPSLHEEVFVETLQKFKSSTPSEVLLRNMKAFNVAVNETTLTALREAFQTSTNAEHKEILEKIETTQEGLVDENLVFSKPTLMPRLALSRHRPNNQRHKSNGRAGNGRNRRHNYGGGRRRMRY